MSDAEHNLVPNVVAVGPAAASWWQRCETWLGNCSDRLNPILVKEARQSLKSTQFAVTFFLLLAGGWMWSLVGVAINLPAIYYRPMGMELLLPYYLGLGFPLIVIVPYVAFRSLVGEREDGTYELLSISTLTPRQIIGGKLVSAMLQMLIYLSALAPCIGFTYLLRGIDIVTIALLLFLVVGYSLVLSSAGLLIGTMTRVRHWNSVLSVLIILGLLLAYNIFLMGATQVLSMGGRAAPVDRAEFWLAVFTIASAGAGYVALLLTAAAARITFKSENRSTRLRWVMLMLQAVAVGWGLFFAAQYDFVSALVMLMAWSNLHWAVFGLLVNGETPFLSERARRQLPQTFLGRLLFTWMNPGPRTGYIFTCTALGAVTVLIVAVSPAGEFGLVNSSSTLLGADFLRCFALVSWGYVAIYLALGNWLVALVRQFVRLDMIAAFILQPLLPFLGSVAPVLLSLLLTHDADYSVWQITNPFWTLMQIADDSALSARGGLGYFSAGPYSPLALVVILGGALVFLLQLVFTLRETQVERLAAPERVREEEVRLAPLPPAPGPQHPWDVVEPIAPDERQAASD